MTPGCMTGIGGGPQCGWINNDGGEDGFVVDTKLTGAIVAVVAIANENEINSIFLNSVFPIPFVDMCFRHLKFCQIFFTGFDIFYFII